MMKRTIICTTLCLMMANGVEAQGLLNKVGKALGKVSNTIDKVSNTLDDVSKGKKPGTKKSKAKKVDSWDAAEEEERSPTAIYGDTPMQTIKGRKSNMLQVFNDNSYGMDANEKAFAQFKDAPQAKTVTLDNINRVQLGYFHCGRAFVYSKGGGMVCIDTKGNVIKRWSPAEAEQYFITGRSFSLRPVFPKFDSNRFLFFAGVESSQKAGTAIIYDTNFNVVKRIPQVVYASNFESGVAIIHKYNGQIVEKYEMVYIDTEGNEILRNISALSENGHGLLNDQQLRPRCDGLTAFAVRERLSDRDKWGFYDAKGNIVVEPKYAKVQDFSNGMAAVATTDTGVERWGFIDTKGNMVIQPKYGIEPSQFDNCGLAMVTNKDGVSSFINKRGETVGNKYTDVSPFCNGRAIYTEFHNGDEGKYASHMPNDMTYLIDSNFNIVATLGNNLFVSKHDNGMDIFKKGFNAQDNAKFLAYAETYEPSTFFKNNQMYFRLQGEARCGLLDANGDIVVGGLNGFFSEGLAPVNNTDSSDHSKNYAGYVNQKGEWVIKFGESEF